MMHSAADVRSLLQPLLSWLQQNSVRLKAQGRWPLQQEDIPPNLQAQWSVYQQNKQQLQAAAEDKRSQALQGHPLSHGQGQQQAHTRPPPPGPEQSPARTSVQAAGLGQQFTAGLFSPLGQIAESPCIDDEASPQCIPGTNSPVTRHRALTAGDNVPRRALFMSDGPTSPTAGADRPTAAQPLLLARVKKPAVRSSTATTSGRLVRAPLVSLPTSQPAATNLAVPEPHATDTRTCKPTSRLLAACQASSIAHNARHHLASSTCPHSINHTSIPQPAESVVPIPAARLTDSQPAHSSLAAELPSGASDARSPRNQAATCTAVTTTPAKAPAPGGSHALPHAASPQGVMRPAQRSSPLVSPPVRRSFGLHAAAKKGLGFALAASERERCLTLPSPHRTQPASSSALALPMSPPAARRPTDNTLPTAAANSAPSPLLRAPKYDISDVLLGSPSPWKGPTQDPRHSMDRAPQVTGRNTCASPTRLSSWTAAPQDNDIVVQDGVLLRVSDSEAQGGPWSHRCRVGKLNLDDGGVEGLQPGARAGSLAQWLTQADGVQPGQGSAHSQAGQEQQGVHCDGDCHLIDGGNTAATVAHLVNKEPATATGAAHSTLVQPGAPSVKGKSVSSARKQARAPTGGSAAVRTSRTSQPAVQQAGVRKTSRGRQYQPMVWLLNESAQPTDTAPSCSPAVAVEASDGPTYPSAAGVHTASLHAPSGGAPACIGRRAAGARRRGTAREACEQEVLGSGGDAEGQRDPVMSQERRVSSRSRPRRAAQRVAVQQMYSSDSDEEWPVPQESESSDGSDMCEGSDSDVPAARARQRRTAVQVQGSGRQQAPGRSKRRAVHAAPVGLEGDEELSAAVPAKKRARGSSAKAVTHLGQSGGTAGGGGGGGGHQESSVAVGTQAHSRGSRVLAATREVAAGASGAAGRTRGGQGGKASSRPPAERKNFVKLNASGNRGKFSFNFQSRSAARGGTTAGRTRLRRINGKIVRMQFKAPAMAGQGADVLEGFQASSRCFICGRTGHWAHHCPSNTGQAPEQLQRAVTEREDAEAAAGLAPGSTAPADTASTGANATNIAPGRLFGGGSGPAWGQGAAGGRPQAATAADLRTAVLNDLPTFELAALLPVTLRHELADTLGFQPSALEQGTDGALQPPATADAAQPTAAEGHLGSTAAAATAEAPAAATAVVPQAPVVAAGASMGVAGPAQLTDRQLQEVLRTVWGHSEFRGGQLDLIRAALEGRNVAGVLPTGAGKSLCYQLPAILLPGVCLVVSPLLALMRDQLQRLPAGVKGCMLWGGQTREEAEAVLQAVRRGAVKLLYVAPEKLHNPAVLDALKRLPTQLSLVCVDEAHCVSEWGHSFRPAYYRLGSVLRNVIKPRCIMALTATATCATQNDITQVLGVPSSALVRELPLRDNLRLHVLHMNGGTASGRSTAWLLAALKPGGVMAEVKRAVVYVAFQAQADETAQTLTRGGVRAVAYHAGKDMNERQRVQEAFSAGGARVVVATVAFGMGVDESDLGAVVHLQMPRSLEDYVQQVGRAGRDGSTARCYLLLDSEDYLRLRSLAHSGAVEAQAVRALLDRIFTPLQASLARPAAGDTQQRRVAAFGVLPTKQTALELDMTEEVMETVISYLQGPDGRGLVAALPPTCTTIDIRFHRTTPAQLAPSCPLVAAILATKAKVVKGVHKVSMAKLVSCARVSTSSVVAQLAELARKQEIHFELSRDRALAWRVVTSQTPDLDALATQLHERLVRHEQVAIRRLDAMYALMASAASHCLASQQEQAIRAYAAEYFTAHHELPPWPPGTDPSTCTQDEHDATSTGEEEKSHAERAGALPVVLAPERLTVQVAAFLKSQHQQIANLGRPLSGIAVARIFHGLSTPAYPSDQWRKCGFWGRYTSWDFRAIANAVEEQIQQHSLTEERV